MKSLSSLGLGLSLVFGCLLLALIAELYYLLWWKKRISKSKRGEIDHSSKIHEPQQANFHGGSGDSDKDFWYKKPFGEDGHGNGNGEEEEEEEDEDELMLKLQNMAGPTRFLFTIKEETKEDMAESEDGKSRTTSRKGSRSRSLSDLFHIMEMEKTPYLTPMASPPYFTPPLTPLRITTNSYSVTDEAYETEFFNNWLKSPSPSPSPSPSSSPNFQFLKNAEKKLHKKRLDLDLEIHKNGVLPLSSSPSSLV